MMMRADEGPFRLHLKAHEQDEHHPKKAKSDSSKQNKVRKRMI